MPAVTRPSHNIGWSAQCLSLSGSRTFFQAPTLRSGFRREEFVNSQNMRGFFETLSEVSDYFS